MLAIFKPVFESVWKRKETKIFLSFAILFPTLLLISTYLPEGSNFMIPSTTGDYRFSFVSLCGQMLKANRGLALPVLALFYLTFTVFRSEIDNHTLFLYKDIKRKDIMGAKILSLFLIVVLYTVLFLVIMMMYYFTRIGHMDYAVLTFWDHMYAEDNLAFLQLLIGGILDLLVCVLLAACLSLYKGVGMTMTMAFVYSIGSSILGILGFSSFFPTGDVNALYEGTILFQTLGTSALVTVIYSAILMYFTNKFFKKMEY